MDWSYQLLTETEQRVFNRLSVFQGGWTLMSAEDVVGDEDTRPGEVLDTIGRLVEQSMVVVEPGPTSRYRMLETLRQYAAEQLVASGQAVELARRHAAYFRGVVERAEVALRGHEQRPTLRLLRDEQPNIRAALAFLGGPDGDRRRRPDDGRLPRDVLAPRPPPRGPAGAVPAGRRPRRVARRPGRWRCRRSPSSSVPAAAWCTPARGAPRPRRRAWPCSSSSVTPGTPPCPGCCSPSRGSPVRNRNARERCSSAAEEQFVRDGDPWGPAVIGFVRMETAIKTGDVDAAVRVGRSHGRRVPAARRRVGTVGHPLPPRLGAAAVRPVTRRAPALEEAIDVARAAGLWNTAQWALADLAIAQVHLGDPDAARRLFDEAADASREIGDGAGEILADYGYGLLAHVDEDWPEAAAPLLHCG